MQKNTKKNKNKIDIVYIARMEEKNRHIHKNRKGKRKSLRMLFHFSVSFFIKKTVLGPRNYVPP